MYGVLAKAKKISDGSWIEGYYVYQFNQHQIYLLDGPENGFEYYFIDENTLCFWTGRTDVNGCKVWSNDVVEDLDIEEVGIVKYSTENSCFYLHIADCNEPALMHSINIKVQGNAFDHVSE